MDENLYLSVVIIAKNEEENIARCIEAIIRATRNIRDTEIILVDSASTDNTVEIAKRYTIKIILVDPEIPLSASAARYIGSHFTRGKFIHFQDGDSILGQDWFKYSLPFIVSHKDIAGVVGKISQEPYENIVVKRWMDDNNGQLKGEVTSFEEDILIKKDALMEAGNFNPWLKAKEEGDLCYRILEKGHKIYHLPVEMSHHMGGAHENLKGLLKRKIIFTIALGQIFRYSITNKKIFFRRLFGFKYLVFITSLFPLALINLLFLQVFTSMKIILAIFLGLFFAMILEKKDIHYAITHIISISLRWPFLIYGLLLKKREIQDYPLRVKIVKDFRSFD